jgi:glutaredoxin
MIKVLGTNNCSRCEMTKTILINKNIEFEYNIITDLPSDLQSEYMSKAREIGQMSFPLIIKDGEFIQLQEVM